MFFFTSFFLLAATIAVVFPAPTYREEAVVDIMKDLLAAKQSGGDMLIKEQRLFSLPLNYQRQFFPHEDAELQGINLLGSLLSPKTGTNTDSEDTTSMLQGFLFNMLTKMITNNLGKEQAMDVATDGIYPKAVFKAVVDQIGRALDRYEEVKGKDLLVAYMRDKILPFIPIFIDKAIDPK